MMRNVGKRPAAWLTAGHFVAVLLVCSVAGRLGIAGEETVAGDPELPIRWQFSAPILLPADPADPAGALLDVLLDPRVFTHARWDLGDLRLYDQALQPVPYALRVLQATHRLDPFNATEFNRAAGPDGSSELTLELPLEGPNQQPIEHNEVEITTPGSEFRRHVIVEGSDDGTTWSKLAETDLLRFRRGEQGIEGNAVTYSPSRFRQIRMRVYPDKLLDKDAVTIERAIVLRRVDVPGELVTHEGQLGPREPARGDGGPGSAWIVDFGGGNVPCDRIEVDVEDAEFVRDFRVEVGGPAELRQPFQTVSGGVGVWQRRAGQGPQPLTATFTEVHGSRLRLIVTDYGNPPLTIRAVRFSAPARQLVFARTAAADAQVRLFFGNPEAAAPNYDFARNLAPQLPTPPTRTTLGTVQTNPDFLPPPKPWTERWPWLIYAVLAAASAVLALIIFSVARRAIAMHDGGGGVSRELTGES